MDALQYLKEKYEIEGNTHYFREPDLPLSTSLEKVCKYMQEYSDQQNAELREQLKETENSLDGTTYNLKRVVKKCNTLTERVKELEGALTATLNVARAYDRSRFVDILDKAEKTLKK